MSSVVRNFSTLPTSVNGVVYASGGGSFTPLNIGSGLSLSGTTLSATSTTTAPVVTNITGTFVLNNSTPRVTMAATGAYPTGGFNVGTGIMETWFDLVSSGYFANNPNGHMAVVTRADTSVMTTAVYGQGMIFGNVNGNTSGGATHYPTTQIESWFNGFATGNYLPPTSDGYTSKPLVDGVTYRACITSTVAPNSKYYIRYRLWRLTTTYGLTTYELERDTGDVYDPTNYISRETSGLYAGHVFANGSAPAWSLTFSNVSIVWKPFVEAPATESPSWLGSSTSGSYVDLSTNQSVGGNKTFTGNTIFSGTTTTSNYLYINNFAMLRGASKFLGTTWSTSYNIYNYGGTNAKTFADNVTLDWDAICAVNFISGFIGSTYNAGNLENMVRPLYCVLSVLINELQARRLI